MCTLCPRLAAEKQRREEAAEKAKRAAEAESKYVLKIMSSFLSFEEKRDMALPRVVWCGG